MAGGPEAQPPKAEGSGGTSTSWGRALPLDACVCEMHRHGPRPCAPTQIPHVAALLGFIVLQRCDGLQPDLDLPHVFLRAHLLPLEVSMANFGRGPSIGLFSMNSQQVPFSCLEPCVGLWGLCLADRCSLPVPHTRLICPLTLTSSAPRTHASLTHCLRTSAISCSIVLSVKASPRTC